MICLCIMDLNTEPPNPQTGLNLVSEHLPALSPLVWSYYPCISPHSNRSNLGMISPSPLCK